MAENDDLPSRNISKFNKFLICRVFIMFLEEQLKVVYNLIINKNFFFEHLEPRFFSIE